MSCGTGWTTLAKNAASWTTIAAYVASCPDILLDTTSVDTGAAIGTLVGTFSITDGFGTYTYSLADGGAGGYFEIVGDQLLVIISPDFATNPSVTIIVEADNGLSADPVSHSFIISVNNTPSYSPSYDFSDDRNSQYL